MYNTYYCFYEIGALDQIIRKKVKNQMQICSIEKVSISYTQKSKSLNPTKQIYPLAALSYITGQRCQVVSARQSISSWNLRKNTVIGCKVTLRRHFAFAFLEKLYLCGLYTIKIETWKGFKEKLCTKTKGLRLLPKKSFGVSENRFFFELQKPSIKLSNFSGFYINIYVS